MRAGVRRKRRSRAALKHLEELARYDPSFAEAVEQVRSARAMAGDVSATVRDYAGKIQASPERLVEIEDRLALLDRLKRKYGADLAEVIAYGRQVRATSWRRSKIAISSWASCAAARKARRTPIVPRRGS